MKKKLIAWAMALALCLTLLPGTADASTVITIGSQILQKAGSGQHTLASEFQPEGVKRSGQNIRITNVKASGTCGDNLTWTLDGSGTLTISGTGAMNDWNYSANVPWYNNRDSITEVVIANGVTSIGRAAFSYCINLTSITIPDSVTAIGYSAFEECDSLTSITIPDNVTSIGDYTFGNCFSLTSVTIPDNVTNIGDWAFSDCTSLTSVTFGDGLTSIGMRAFTGCTSLTSVAIGDGVTTIGDYAFWECTSLASVTIPEGVTTISEGVFCECTSLIDVYYGGSETDRNAISIGEDNDVLNNATWHYNSSGSETPATTTPKSGFSDVLDDSPFSDAVAWAVEQKITTGVTANSFEPSTICTNNHILTFLWRSQSSPESTGDNDFAKAINWAKSQGIADADVNGGDYCTRADAVTYLWKLAGSPSVENSVSFPDVPADADYADAVAWAVENEITTGFSDGTFGPDNTCTRGQIVTFLYRAYA